uniref:Gfo/Idh/MocA family protein n=1 Tax=uncultured Christiangramia sp. TaxID=503836 RepID=UPI002623EE5B|nr:Gfo/Idh/MocA family oxidoreductase [uncultured Christiangramia sp.]
MKVLIIGLGSIARKHIKALHEIGEFEIYALRSQLDSPDVENIKNIYDWEHIKSHNFDFFLVSNPTSEHASTITKLVDYRKPLFIEKPIFNKPGAENKDLINSIKTAQISTYIACNLRFLDCISEIKEIVKSSKINEVNIYCGSYLPDWRPGVDFRKVYSANQEMGGGVHIDLIHELDYLFWLFGEPLNTRSTFKNNSSLNISAIDYANYLWEYEGFSANLVLNYYRKDTKRTLEILTSDATYLVDLINNRIFKDNLEVYSSDQKISDTYLAQMNYFINNVLINKESSLNSAQEAYKILQLCIQE